MQDPLRKYQAFANKPAAKKKVRSQQRAKQVARKRKPDQFPVGLFLICVFGLFGSGATLVYPDEVISTISRMRVRIPLLMAAEEDGDTLNHDVGEAQPKGENGLSTKMLTSENAKLTMENTSLNQALEAKRQELEKKERDLARLEEDLEEKKAEIDKQLKELQDMRRNISTVLDDRVVADQESVDKLVAVYANMKPMNAARIISSLNEDLAIKVLGKMKKQSAAAILDFIEPVKAQTLSEKYAGLKKSK